MKKRIHFLLIVFISCSVGCFAVACDSDSDPVSAEEITDYSDHDNWLYVSEGTDLKPVDVFFIYPTAYFGEGMPGPVTDPEMRERAYGIRQNNAIVYEETANLFMPYYRQLNASKFLNLPVVEQDELMRKTNVKDILAAFEYYLENYNEGRPFILAGHSQGSYMILFMLEYLKDKQELMDRMVAAYVIGYAVTAEFMSANSPHRFASGRTDTGVVISWNTEAPGMTIPNPVILPGSLAINPITWTTDETHAPKELSFGSRMSEGGIYVTKEHYADAQVDKERGVVICASVTPEESTMPDLFPTGIMHVLDYPLYFYDLQENVKERTAAFMETWK